MAPIAPAPPTPVASAFLKPTIVIDDEAFCASVAVTVTASARRRPRPPDFGRTALRVRSRDELPGQSGASDADDRIAGCAVAGGHEREQQNVPGGRRKGAPS